ncbi:serine protease [Bacillus sp. AFS015802]|uniref:S1C family serine protease n=1 Tax=Bacillus sp. AFS015802 TaxID=2033486 RepID=UPI000BFA7DBD|nr:trypsin-like peptidase domain-containing protein [Bacillus sp. AFS015802]PFA63013.1 serine protease [Bacillus sp. AFS015802]
MVNEMNDDKRGRKTRVKPVRTAIVSFVLGVLVMFLVIEGFNIPGKEGTEEATSKSTTVKASAEGVDGGGSIAEAVEKSRPSVVSVVNFKGGNMFEGSEPQPAGSGSGVIYEKEGNKAYIVTNHHVVEGASKLEVALNDGSKIPAKLLGSDALLDLAVLEVDSGKVKDVIEIGKSSSLKPGQRAIAIGNPLGFLAGTVTAGVISAADRSMPVDINKDGAVDWQSEVIQTDASINPGNSGGALINMDGELIGINSSKIAMENVEGIGFAIPVDIALPALKDLREYGEVKRPFIGIVPVSLSQIPSQYYDEPLNLPDEVKEGIVVRQAEPGTPAGEAGLQQYDVITMLDGEKMTKVSDLRKYLYNEKEVGSKVEVTYYRNGEQKTTTLTLSDLQ